MTRLTSSQTLIFEFETVNFNLPGGAGGIGAEQHLKPTGRVRKVDGTWFELPIEIVEKIAEYRQ